MEGDSCSFRSFLKPSSLKPGTHKPWNIFFQQKSLPVSEVPSIFHEPGILLGYRDHDKPWTYYVLSMFQVNNETIHIWTHLIPFAVFIYKIFFNLEINNSNPFYPVILSFAICSAFCLGLSASAHTFHTGSQFLHYVLYTLDYAGIGLYTFGVSLLIFFCNSHHERNSDMTKYFLAVNVAMSWLGFTGTAVSKLRYRRPYPFARKLIGLLTFGIQFFFVCYFLLQRVHVCYQDYKCEVASLSDHGINMLTMTLSVFFFSSHQPEKIFPGVFDFVGQSHQLFHILTGILFLWQLETALIDVRHFSAVTDDLPSMRAICIAMVSYGISVAVTMFCLVSFTKKRVQQDKMLDKEKRNLHFE